MKETKIAKENIKKLKKKSSIGYYGGICESHKQTCQRWLDFLEIHLKDQEIINWIDQFTLEKIEDLKQAIKLYEEVGI